MPLITPPHVTAPKSVRTSLKLLRQSARCVIETWPETMYTAESYQPPVKSVIYVMKQAALSDLFVTHADRFEQSHLLRRIIKPVWRNGIATGLGTHWRWQRRAAAPVFTPKSVSAIIPAASDAAKNLLSTWHALGDSPREVTHDLGDAAQQVVLDGLLGRLSDARSTALLQQHGAELTGRTGRINYADLLMLPDWSRRFLGPTLSGPSKALHREIAARLTALTDSEDTGALLQLLQHSKDPESGQIMSQDLLRDNIVGSISAGRETTALAISWALYLLALDQDSQTRLRDEIVSVMGDADITADMVGKLTLTRSVLHEAMRLYPPAPQIARDCIADTSIGGIAIKKGTVVSVPIYAIHRSSLHWDSPNAFDPDRFTAPDAFAKHNRFRYLPFGGGARVCLGQAFAMTEAVVILAYLLRALHVSDATRGEMRFETGAALRAKGGIHLRFSPL